MVSKAFAEGMEAHANGTKLESNPYCPTDHHMDHHDWLAGWHQDRRNKHWD